MGGSPAEKIGYKEIYKGFWKCRDFELAHFWQRAIFLSAFLLACYAGYGSFIIHCATAETLRLSFAVINDIAVVVCVVGLVLSLMWIMMAKGSKAWYEHYEAAINAFVDRYAGRNVFEGDLAEMAGFEVGNTEEYNDNKIEEVSSWLWNARAGSFSVSKINIAIGHLSALLWGGLLLMHIAFAQRGFATLDDASVFLQSFITPRLLIAAVSGILLLFWVYSKMHLKSSYFGDK